MKTKRKLSNIVLSFLLVFTLFAGLISSQVNAAGNTVNVTLHKHQFTEMPNATLNTGAEIENFGGTPLEGVEFTVYDVTDLYHRELKVLGATQESVNSKIQTQYTPFAPESSVGITKTTNKDGLAVFENLEVKETEGEKRFKVYVFVETKTSLSISVIQKAAPMVIAMPIYQMVDGKHSDTLLTNVHLYPKNVTAEDEKVFKNTGKFESVGVEGKKHFNVPVGANLDFEVTLNIPADIAKMTQYSLTDTPSAGLKYVDGTVKVGALEPGKDYTFVPNGDGFTIEFVPTSETMAALAGKTLIITYDMQLTTEVTPDSLYDNNAKVTVNTVGRADMKTSPEDPKFYTSGHKFVKKDAQTDNVLEGAKFKVGKKGATPAEDKFAKFTTNTKAEHSFIGWETEANATEISSNKDGQLFVIGLLKGDYILKETAAPSVEYVKIDQDINFTVADGYASQEIQTVFNHPKGLLPSTGGKGIYGFVAVGSLMMVASVIWFKRSTRKETN